jgi:hypothetical protein
MHLPVMGDILTELYDPNQDVHNRTQARNWTEFGQYLGDSLAEGEGKVPEMSCDHRVR